MRRAVLWLAGVILTSSLLLPGLFLSVVLLRHSDNIDEIDQAPTPLVVAPTWTSTLDAVSGTVTATITAGVDVRSSGGDGMVTAVPVSPGSVVHEGDAVYEVDAVARLAVSTPIPFFRRLALGSEGNDVVMLKELLRRLGVEHSSDPTSGTYDAETGRAVQEWRTSLGDRSPAKDFEPEMVVWLPTESVSVATVLVSVGSVVPARGETVIRRSAFHGGVMVGSSDQFGWPA